MRCSNFKKMDCALKPKRAKLMSTSTLEKVKNGPEATSVAEDIIAAKEIVNKIADVIPKQRKPKIKLWKIGEIPKTFYFCLVTYMLLINAFDLFNKYAAQTSTSLTIKNVDRSLYELHIEISQLRKQLERLRDDSFNSGTIDSKIAEALDLYDADKVGMIDFALQSAGAAIVDTPDTKAHPTKLIFYAWGLFELKLYSKPQALLTPGTQPGECFAFTGNRGRIQIRLPQRVEVGAVSIDHVRAKLVQDNRSAPKQFKVIGYNDDSQDYNILGEYEYNIDGRAVQTFKVSSFGITFRYVELNIMNNHGNNEFTCVYRFRVHGKAA